MRKDSTHLHVTLLGCNAGLMEECCGEECCREVSWRSVVEECSKGVLRRSVIEKRWREVV